MKEKRRLLPPWRRALIAAAALLGSKQASAAGVASVVTAAAFVPLVEHAGPWILGMLGSTIVHAYRPPKSTQLAIANGVISVVLGGLGGPVLAAWAAGHFPIMADLRAVLLTSGALAASWPWLAPKLWAGLARMWEALIAGFVNRQGGGDGRA